MSDQVVVPRILGLDVDDARTVAHDVGLVLVSGTIDGPPLRAQTWPGYWTVTSQTPGAGAEVERWAELAITFTQVGGGDEAPVPAKPYPDPQGPLRAEAEPEVDQTLLDLS
jgi:hypothetical protein